MSEEFMQDNEIIKGSSNTDKEQGLEYDDIAKDSGLLKEIMGVRLRFLQKILNS